jgi:hypothetical protein
MHPRQILDTSIPVDPSRVYFIVVSDPDIAFPSRTAG